MTTFWKVNAMTYRDLLRSTSNYFSEHSIDEEIDVTAVIWILVFHCSTPWEELLQQALERTFALRIHVSVRGGITVNWTVGANPPTKETLVIGWWNILNAKPHFPSPPVATFLFLFLSRVPLCCCQFLHLRLMVRAAKCGDARRRHYTKHRPHRFITQSTDCSPCHCVIITAKL